MTARPVTLAHLAQLLFLGVVWGGAFLFMHVASTEIGAVWTAEIRIVIGAVILLAIFGRRTWRAARHDLVAFAIAGTAFSAIPFTLISFAVLTLPVGFGAILNASTPLFTALLGVIWLGDRLSARMLLGLGIGVSAVVVLVGWSPLEVDLATLVAVLAALGAAMGYAFGGTFVKRRLPGVGGTELATGQLTAGAIILLPFAIATGAPGHAVADGGPGPARGRHIVDGTPLADLHATPAFDQPHHRELRHVRRARVRDHLGCGRPGRVDRA